MTLCHEKILTDDTVSFILKIVSDTMSYRGDKVATETKNIYMEKLEKLLVDLKNQGINASLIKKQNIKGC